jgi:Uma2 family endonuclease
MSVMSTLPRGRGLTIDDLGAMPDDGRRYELIDGVLLVSAMPVPIHQRMGFLLNRLLDDAAPRDLWVLGPVDVELGQDTMVEPDLIVAPRASFNDKRLPVAPLLAVEVLSPSTAITDLNVKFARYERAGIASYWVLDPKRPGLVVWELREGRYVEVADVAGDEPFDAVLPFPVRIVPRALVD